MIPTKRLPTFAALLLSVACCFAGPVEYYANTIAPLIDPAKLASLKARTVNPRVRNTSTGSALREPTA